MPLDHSQTNHVFGEVAALNELFCEAKKLRKARLPARILVVEDDPLTRRIVTNSFKEDYAMVSSDTAQAGVADYLMHAPDIVFLDIGLPDVDGFAALDLIMGVDPDAFIVMFSSNDYPENIEKSLKMGAKGFVSKPFKKETMQRYIHGSAVHHHKQSI